MRDIPASPPALAPVRSPVGASHRESEAAERINHEVTAPAWPRPFTPPDSLSPIGTEVGQTGIWRPFPSNIVVNAIARKGFLGICSA